MATEAQGPDLTAVSKLLQLESMARAATSAEALYFMMVNEKRRYLIGNRIYFYLNTQ